MAGSPAVRLDPGGHVTRGEELGGLGVDDAAQCRFARGGSGQCRRAGKLVMSFHGMPARTLRLGDPYHCECLKTGRLLAEKLQLEDGRLARHVPEPLRPRRVAAALHRADAEGAGQGGAEGVDVICPGFAADCLETLEEIAIEARAAFLAAGGKTFHYIPCLNNSPEGMKAMTGVALRHLQGWDTDPHVQGSTQTTPGPRHRARRLRIDDVPTRPSPSDAPAAAADMRLDKWLWVARFFKTRGLAADEVEKGRVQVNGQAAKPARSVRVNDLIEIRQPGSVRELLVLGLGAMRGPATVARTLYQETEASIRAQQQAAEARKFGVEPANAQELGRPTKRDRRDLVDWQRWSASVDDE